MVRQYRSTDDEETVANEARSRKMGLSEWLDRLLIGAVAAIFIWFGTRIDNLSIKVESLLTAMATTIAKQDSTDKRIEANEKHIDMVESDLKEHFKEDRARFSARGPK